MFTLYMYIYVYKYRYEHTNPWAGTEYPNARLDHPHEIPPHLEGGGEEGRGNSEGGRPSQSQGKPHRQQQQQGASRMSRGQQ